MTTSTIDHMADLAEQLRTILETGARPWIKTWDVAHNGGPITASGKPFTGGNAPWLMLVAANRGYRSSHWFTSKQARDAGCPLDWDAAQGQHATVLRPKFVPDQENPKEMRIVGFMGYRVYNGDLAQGWTDPVREVREIPEPDAAAAAILGLWGGCRHGGTEAFYQPFSDSVTLPPREAFHSLADYVGTGCHEKAHQSGHRTRLNREGIVNPVIWGDHTYAEEELVAESAAAFLLGHLGLQSEAHLNNNAAYLASWNRKLQRDPQVLIRAMGSGMRAARYILQAVGLEA
jgi:antirestriction protein ArdC